MDSRKLARALETERVFADGEYIVKQGDEGSDMFVIRSGGVRISRRVEGQEILLADLERGEFFGEMSLLESLPRDADARALGETRLLVVGTGSLLMRIRRDPSFALEMLHHLSSRIRSLNAQLERALEDDPPA